MLRQRYSWWILNFFTSLDENFIKHGICTEYKRVEKDQEILQRIITRVLDELNCNVHVKSNELLTGDKLENCIKEIRFDAFDGGSENKKKEKLLINANDFED